MLKEKIASFIENIREIDGVAACALVSRDGIIAGKYFDRELNESWFGALAATLLASAESAVNIISMAFLDSVTLRAQNSSIVVMGAGENFLIAAIIRENVNPENVHTRMLAIAKKIGQVM